MIIDIDNREHLLISKINPYLEKYDNIKINIVTLSLGDIIIKDDKNNIIIIIERKTLKDLEASIRDGRYKEQSYRLNECSTPNTDIFYLIEGDILTFKSSSHGRCIDNNILISAMTSLWYTNKFNIYRSKNIDETIIWLLQTAKKLEKLINNNTSNDTKQSSYIDVYHKTPKQNITKDNILEIMLIQIPSVSITTAKPIAEKYKTLKNLIDELDKDKTCLYNITYKCKNGKYRKISKTSIDNIYKYLLDNI